MPKVTPTRLRSTVCLRALALGLALGLLILLAACGGGDEEDPVATVDPPDCSARPELCR
jgi:hypothetical protein